MKTYAQEWLWLKISQRVLPAMTMLITVFLLAASIGCKDSTTEPNTSGQISMTARYSPSDSPLGKFGTMV